MLYMGCNYSFMVSKTASQDMVEYKHPLICVDMIIRPCPNLSDDYNFSL